MTDSSKTITSLRQRANHAASLRCNTLIGVIEYPCNIENIGTVLRNIDALGVSKLYIITNNKELLTYFENNKPGRKSVDDVVNKIANKKIPNTLARVSVSADRWVYVRPFETTAECVAYLAKHNYVSLGTSPHIKGGVNMPLYETDYTSYKKLAIWFGNEAKGLSSEAISSMAGCIQICMAGIVESLNLAVSTGIVLSYIAYCRRQYEKNN